MKATTALFGGTFDPIHNAHIEVAKQAKRRFDLEKVILIPAANPPHKSQGAHASYEDRVAMAELACINQSGLEVSRIEESEPRSYSILTIEKLEATGVTPLAFLIGADAFAEIQTWHRWKDVVQRVEFIVVTRPGAVYTIPPGATVYELTGMNLPVSSSAIREAIGTGEEILPIPAAVLDYIRERNLYQSGNCR